MAALREGKRKDKDKISSLGTDIQVGNDLTIFKKLSWPLYSLFIFFQSLKTAKVKLAKEIKKSAENFRAWKLTQDKEVGKLKAAAARGKFQMDKLTRKHAREHNVLQRKVSNCIIKNDQDAS